MDLSESDWNCVRHRLQSIFEHVDILIVCIGGAKMNPLFGSVVERVGFLYSSCIVAVIDLTFCWTVLDFAEKPT